MAQRLRVGVLDLIANRTNDAWLERSVMMPNFASIMPQAVGAWAEELGAEVFYETYTGREDLSRAMPDDLDLLFLSCFSRASFLAYAIAARYRGVGVPVVLGGPHARSFAGHARPYFDYICQITDGATIQSLLQRPARQTAAVILNAPAQPEALPSVAQRARFIAHNLQKNRARRWVQTVPLLGSLGCPYTCHFCVDAPVPYQTLPHGELVADLRFIEQRFGAATTVFWHDPNFGVRFNDYMGLIEESGTRLTHGGESSLSLLTEKHLRAMQRNRWVAQVPGVESWNGFSDKGGTGGLSGLAKVREVAEHVNLIMAYIPYVQTNFVLGLDADAGAEPFELTKAFVDLAQGAFPGYSILTDFRNARLSDDLAAEGRALSIPQAFLDNTSAFNVRLKNYSLAEFYARLIDLQAHSFNAAAKLRRWRANGHRYVRAVNLGRAFTEGGWRAGQFKAAAQRLAADPSLLRHYTGLQAEAPAFYFEALRDMLGPWWAWLPAELQTPAGFLESERRAAAEPLTTSRVPVAGFRVPSRAMSAA